MDTPNNKSIFERLGKVEVDSEDANESENSDKGKHSNKEPHYFRQLTNNKYLS